MDMQLSYPGCLFCFCLLFSYYVYIAFPLHLFSVCGKIAKKSNLKTRCQKRVRTNNIVVIRTEWIKVFIICICGSNNFLRPLLNLLLL